jgi:Leucine-rich repeat (LRR) protein
MKRQEGKWGMQEQTDIKYESGEQTELLTEHVDEGAALLPQAVGDTGKKRVPCRVAFCLIGAAVILTVAAVFLVRYVQYHSLDYQLSLGQKYLEELRYDVAILAFNRAIEIDPMNADAYLGLAQAYLGKGETENAISALERGIEATGDTRLKEMLQRLRPEVTPTLAPGVYDAPIEVWLNSAGATVYYRMDGQVPDEQSPVFRDGEEVNPLKLITGEMSVTARARSEEGFWGEPVELSYSIQDYVVKWKEPAFERLIRLAMNRPDGDIRCSELQDIESIIILGDRYIWVWKEGKWIGNINSLTYQRGPILVNGGTDYERGDIHTLDDIVHFHNLSTIEVDYNDLENIDALEKLTNKEEVHNLYFNETSISDIRALSGFCGLERVSFSKNTAIRDISALREKPELLEVNLCRNRISDISSLAGATKMKVLYLESNPIRNISALSEMRELYYLGLYETFVSDLKPLSGLSDLQTLDLDETPVFNLAPLRECTGLETLYLRKTKVTDLSPLQGLPNLRKIDLRETLTNDLAPVRHIETVYLDDLDEQEDQPAADTRPAVVESYAFEVSGPLNLSSVVLRSDQFIWLTGQWLTDQIKGGHTIVSTEILTMSDQSFSDDICQSIMKRWDRGSLTHSYHGSSFDFGIQGLQPYVALVGVDADHNPVTYARIHIEQ